MSGKTLVAALVVAATAACVLVGWLGRPEPRLLETPARVRPPLVQRTEPTAVDALAGDRRIEPVEILRAWDGRRADAWARGDSRLLRSLYVPESLAGRADVGMLRAWTARGLVVRGLRTQLLSVQALEHRASSWTLLVTDRLAGGMAVGAGLRRPLPRDRATTRTVRLRQVHGRWRVVSVLPGEVRSQAG